ncbi:sugar MFS transporter [Saccharophagus degradans]|uniref:Glucose/galactose transporter n=1 Tax=Saccharophagus degradans (strain 2-40 / ATCC 43961 / DSM 17024) TaxID=203122 RepID=Q21G84_SACD2|nr:sugar MFS transporter [Saccharophagus degradans]ABD82295.1 glucose/galactose transporter [Saccharophagus degradans 2-40]
MNNELTQSAAPAARAPSTLIPMIIIGTLFFVFGFVTWLNGSLIPFLKIVCELTEFQALFVTFAFYIAYTFMAVPSALVLKRTGYKNGMVVGLGVMAVGALIFIPAAQLQNYMVFLVALFLLGAGLTLLQTAANPYIVCIGPRESAATRISVMGLINKGAGIVVPVVFTTLILTGMDQFEPEVLAALTAEERAARLAELSSRLVTPYIYMAVVLLGLGAFVKFSPLQELEFEDNDSPAVEKESDILKYPQVVLGAIALFTYVGVEVIAGDTIGLYGQTIGVKHFGSLTSYTMAFMVIGYVLGVVCIPKYLSQEKALLGSAVFGMLFVAGVMLSSQESTLISSILFGWAGIPVVPDTITFLALLGLANALVWPAIWPLALQDLGKFTAVGSALLIMGIAGGAIIPLAYGHFAEGGNGQSAYWVMIPCYVFILFYALKGHKMRSWK